MEFIHQLDVLRLSNPGVVSEQLLSPHNSTSARVTITRVTVDKGALQPRHTHESSEQIWIALVGTATLLLEEEETKSFQQGQIVRFEENDVHGLENTGAEPFVYLSVTAPPINFDFAYQTK